MGLANSSVHLRATVATFLYFRPCVSLRIPLEEKQASVWIFFLWQLRCIPVRVCGNLEPIQRMWKSVCPETAVGLRQAILKVKLEAGGWLWVWDKG